MKHRMIIVLIVSALLLTGGCSAVSLNDAHQLALSQRISATCMNEQDTLQVAEANAIFWEQILAASKKFMSGVSLSATYYDLCQQKQAWCAAGAQKIDEGKLTPAGIAEMRVTMCNHLKEFQKASLGVKGGE